MTLNAIDFTVLLPVLMLAGGGCVLMLLDLAIPAERKYLTGWLTLAVLLGAGVALLPWPSSGYLTAFGNMLYADGFATFLSVLFLLCGALTVILALNYLSRARIERGEFYVLMLFSLSGMMLMAQAADLIMVFLALELLSIPLYILAGLARPKFSSEESAMKYFLLGAFASGFLVYGIALTYGATGTTSLTGIVQALVTGHTQNATGITASTSTILLLAGAALILVGLGFKVAAVPFHMWTPDVYDGAPSVVTAFMAVGAKAGGFAALLRVFLIAFPSLEGQWVFAVALLSAMTMILGNFAAIMQTNIKRLLAYSSVAHAGYIMMALVASGDAKVSNLAVGSALFYLLGYAITTLGTWGVVIAVERAEGKEGAGLAIEDYAGLSHRRPGLALAMVLFMLSLTGVPLTIGFIAKFNVFSAVMQAYNQTYLWLAIVGVLTSLASAYYYLRVIVVMYMKPGTPEVFSRPSLQFAVGLTALATFVFGIVPGPLLDFAARSVLALAK